MNFKDTEIEIRSLSETLEKYVIKCLAQWQTANQVLKALGYSVSHHWRAPLRQVIGFVKLVPPAEAKGRQTIWKIVTLPWFLAGRALLRKVKR